MERKIKMRVIGLFGIFILGVNIPPSSAWPDKPRLYLAEQIELENQAPGQAYFFRPVALLFRGGNVWVLDSEDNEVKLFGELGGFLYAFGKKGNAPGEFWMPLDLDVLGERVYVADGANRRVQILDLKGRYLGGFRVPFFPRRILALDEHRVVVAHLPSGRLGKEKMLHCYSEKGELLWEAHDSFFSGDSVYDSFRNDIFLRRGGGEHFYVIGRSEEHLIFKLNGNGAEVRKIKVSEDYPLRKVSIPTAEKGKMKELRAFCWSGDWHEGKFYLAIPDYTERKDVTPGKRVGVVDEGGRVEGFIDFPLTVSSLSVSSAGKRIVTIDCEGELHIFEIKAK